MAILLPKSGGDQYDVSNKQPISLGLTSMRKIFDAILAERIKRHLLETGQISPTQHGYIRGCDGHVLSVTEKIREVRSNGEVTLMVAIDFRKAFDSVVHDFI